MKKEVVEQAKKVLAKKRKHPISPIEIMERENERQEQIDKEIQTLHQICLTITKRIDNIITAHDKCKSLKGL